ncbi:MAG: HypC/HybG/HupF family hydrogenase formation chaperone [Firmicutes bacterium]|nr:HypC/HybG/HupF family hydrogenase formation chaperone [Bacillota bacterium]
MCVAVPGRVVKLKAASRGPEAEVDVSGTIVRADARLVPGLKTGDWVLLHTGVILQVIDESQALETIRFIEETYAAAECMQDEN